MVLNDFFKLTKAGLQHNPNDDNKVFCWLKFPLYLLFLGWIDWIGAKGS